MDTLVLIFAVGAYVWPPTFTVLFTTSRWSKINRKVLFIVVSLLSGYGLSFLLSLFIALGFGVAGASDVIALPVVSLLCALPLGYLLLKKIAEIFCVVGRVTH
jgi:hypothetical protein